MKKIIRLLIGVLVLGAILMLLNKDYNNAVEKCIAGGNTRHYCEVELAK